MITNIDDERGSINFNYTEDKTKRIIKVIGVGGGGGNAVTKMYDSGSVTGVSFLLCNTDQQALDKSSVAHKICLGPNVTKGLGAGNKPNVARQAAEDSTESIREALTSDETEMVFITAGMGGGTGTGAAPIIGKIAMEEDKLTIGIVTIPFVFEGQNKILQALRGVKELKENVDAILVVNNERLIDVYGDLALNEAFDRADATLSNAARGISDMVNLPGLINIDFADVKTTLKAGGVAIISTGVGEGENRLTEAIENALKSPLINHNRIKQAKRILMCLYPSMDCPLLTKEMEAMTTFTSSLDNGFDNIWGYMRETNVTGNKVVVTILASGFDYQTTENSVLGKYPSNEIEDIEAELRGREDDELIRSYYGDKVGKERSVQPLILEIDELDDDKILEIAETTPACKRDLSSVIKLRERHNAAQSQPIVPEPSPARPAPPSEDPQSDAPTRTIFF